MILRIQTNKFRFVSVIIPQHVVWPLLSWNRFVSNTSHTRVWHTCHLYFFYFYVLTCRVHVGVSVSAQHTPWHHSCYCSLCHFGLALFKIYAKWPVSFGMHRNIKSWYQGFLNLILIFVVGIQWYYAVGQCLFIMRSGFCVHDEWHSDEDIQAVFETEVSTCRRRVELQLFDFCRCQSLYFLFYVELF